MYKCNGIIKIKRINMVVNDSLFITLEIYVND